MASKAGDSAHTNEEAAAAKLWAVYVSEAEKYDRGLVESWKGDMEGLLIFAALFSSILTAFIIESYKSLNADSGDLTVQLLAQISRQLAASSNGSAFDFPSPTPFSPTASSVICNVLWFISLGFSLACALVATFVQQWSRDFLHKTDMRSAPAIRARIFSYLYYGLKRFQMHTVVEIIPLLLHGSLILFFCGLVAFLIPVNIATTIVAGAILAIVAAVYSALTFLPLLFLDCPYRTPLSGAFWRVLRGRLWNRRDTRPATDVEASLSGPVSEPQLSQMEALSRAALETRSERDYKALVWTMKSLADDVELEPFVEAIPDVLWGPSHRRRAYEPHIRALIHNPDVQLLTRIDSLLDSCDHGILSSDGSQRRRITCFKAVWVIASLSVAESGNRLSEAENAPAIDLTMHMQLGFGIPGSSDSVIAPYFISARAMWLWNAFCVVKMQLLRLQERLKIINDNPRGLAKISASLGDIAETFYMLPIAWEPAPQSGPKLESLMDASLTEIPVRIILEFLFQSNRLDSPPYQWLGTHSTIRVPQKVPFSLQKSVEDNLWEVISTQLPKLKSEANKTKIAWISHSIRRSLDLWRRLDSASIPPAIIDLLNWQESPNQLHYMLDNHDVLKRLWDCFPRTLFEGPEMREEAFSALWHLASFGHRPSTREYLELRHGGVAPQLRTLASIESLLNRFLLTQTPFHLHTHSIIALLKARILAEQLTLRHFSKLEKHTLLEHHLLPAKTAIPFSNRPRSERGRLAEAVLLVVAEYLEHCAGPGSLPYKAAETLHKMTRRESRPLTHIHPTRIHPAHQIRLANAIWGVYSHDSVSHESSQDCIWLREEILDCEFWKIYAEGQKTEKQVKERLALSEYSDGSWPWLDNLEALGKIKDAFLMYERDLASTGGVYHARVRTILQGIDCWHPEADTAHQMVNWEGDPLRSNDQYGQVGDCTEEKAASDM